ncbi:UNC-50 protein [Cylindrobasidium torrendii FP15055 ss-10]|uniref:UNC-50 protein n=1 Tax=Cylindrobasidium torrendii FP15055 ss-10 TaxID=1314674 RepID=A0A0D7AZ34_9AGAR|nr:UNC-50 protein [Cylindrobasidium torrendii FP15055 ss-10]
MDLPTYSGAGSSTRSMSSRIPIIFRRLHRFQQMDFELAAWQLTYLCLAPKRVYRNVYFHKQTKNTWARDDPAILVLIGACLCLSAVAWSVVYSYSIFEALQLAFLMILRDYLLTGAAVATVLWFTCNRLLLAPPTHSTPADSSVEWAYAFDVHTNAFFPLYLALYLAQLFLLPVILKDNWVCLWVGNTLYLAAFAQYTYGVYLGLNALPFLARSELLLSPLLPLFTAYVISLLGFNVAKHVLPVYFGS